MELLAFLKDQETRSSQAFIRITQVFRWQFFWWFALNNFYLILYFISFAALCANDETECKCSIEHKIASWVSSTCRLCDSHGRQISLRAYCFSLVMSTEWASIFSCITSVYFGRYLQMAFGPLSVGDDANTSWFRHILRVLWRRGDILLAFFRWASIWWTDEHLFGLNY